MADVKCKLCGAEYPEEWGECQCVTVSKSEPKEKKAKEKKK